ncbi:MAG: acyltransferase [Clostridia bacterium]|nr:acyltransferase [Clostridia bacterium]
MNKGTRCYGIDLLRIVSIIGVCFLHVLGHGGILASANTIGRFSLVWMLEILAYPAVNCFVLISGYVGFREGKYYPKLKNIISLFFTVVFYGALLCLIFKAIYPELISKDHLIAALAPIKHKNYWFFTCYAGMFVLSPVINAFVHNARGKHLMCLLLAITVCTFLSLEKDVFVLSGGYSVMWFVLLYLLGAIIKKYDLTALFSAKLWVALGVIALLITCLFKIGGTFSSVPFLQENKENLVSYASPTVLLMAVAWLGAFSKLQRAEKAKKIISFFATSAFSVYLIHDNIFVRNFVISKIHLFTDKLSAPLLAASVVALVLGIFLVCTLIDKAKIGLFSLIKIDLLAEKIELLAKKLIAGACKKIKSLKNKA